MKHAYNLPQNLINRNLDLAQFLMDMTGWNVVRMKQARRDRILTFRAKNDKKGYEYLLESLNEKFILKVIYRDKQEK